MAVRNKAVVLLRAFKFDFNPSTPLSLFCCWLQNYCFDILVPKFHVGLHVLNRILCSIVAEFRMFFWKRGNGKNWEHSVLNFAHPTSLRFLERVQNQQFPIVMNTEALLPRDVFIALLSISTSLPL